MATFQQLTTKALPTWCPGCGDFGILASLKLALVEKKSDPEQTLIISGIGCSSKLPHWIDTYGFHGIHGRALPIATGAHLSNTDLTIIVISGDGDGYGIGMGHFIHACRRNLDIVYIVHNNQIYGLTKGQASPTTEKGEKTKTTPEGSIESPIDPLTLAISAGATFVARAFSDDQKHLRDLIIAAMDHPGFALIDVLQPCVTFNHHNTREWFKQRLYKLEDTEYDPTDKTRAFTKALEWGDKVPVGLFYKETGKPRYSDDVPQITKTALVKQPIQPNITPLMEGLV